MVEREECQHFWFVSVYSFYKEENAETTTGPTITKGDASYPTFQHRIETVGADPQSAGGMRATEIICAHCGQQKDIPWPPFRTEDVSGVGIVVPPRPSPAP